MLKQKLTKENKKSLELMFSNSKKVFVTRYEKDCKWNKRCSLDCDKCLHLVKGINDV